MPTRDWQFLVWKSTATSLSTALVDFTITNSQLVETPVITGSRLRVLDGQTEARPWTLQVLDSSSFITSQLAVGGRLEMLNRFVQGRLSVDGSTYRPVAGGRIVDIENAGNIATYAMTVQDEWLSGSHTMLFTTNTTILYPPKPYRGYKGAAANRAAIGRIERIKGGTPRRYWYVTLQPGGGGCPPLTEEGAGFIRGDLTATLPGLSTLGSFQHLRFRAGGTDYKVVGFKNIAGPFSSTLFGNYQRPDPEDHLFDQDSLHEHQTQGGPLTFWVAASSTAFGGSGSDTFDLTDDVGLHAMTAPASPATPLHIWPGWSSANPFGTVHPMQVLKDVLDGAYSASSEAVPYYSTESFTGTADVRRLPTVGTAFRITSPAPLKEWVTDNLLAPHGIAAFGDSRGKVAFKSILLPDPQLGYSTSNLFQFTSTNLTSPHPDFRASRREQVTQVELEYERVSLSVSPGAIADISGAASYTPTGYQQGGDGLSVMFATTRFTSDRVNRYGVWSQRYRFAGYGVVGDYNPYNAFPTWVGALQYWQGSFVQQIFDRYADGGIQGTLTSLTGSTVQPGDFTRMTLGSYPNISNSQRGGTRLVQILSKDITPSGFQFEYLDAGGAAAIPTSPTITLSTSTAYPKHALRATVSAGIPSGGVVQLLMAESATTSAPGSSNAAWHPVVTTGPYGMVRTTGVYTLPQLKSNQRYFVKGQAFSPSGPRSNYSTPVTRVTGAITAISGLSMSSVKAQTAGASWTVGDAGYPVDLHVDTSTSATPTTGNLLYRMPPGTNRTLIQGLTQGQAYRSWVRHADAYGGFSGADSTTFTMTSTATTSNVRKAPALGGMYTVFGST